MLGGRPWSEWVESYARSHRHPLNQAAHLVGIPLVVGSILLALGSIGIPSLRVPALALFLVGWGFQFGGHALEGKPPEFLSDPRFLLVGVRWWLVKVTAR
jgi:uncharacterized membrane protein YGL010W